MTESTKPVNTTHSSAADSSNIGGLIAALADSNRWAAHNAREALVDIGKSAVAPLIELLTDPRERVRWEAAKALSEIHDPAAAPALVSALEDESFGVRWLAAKGLIGLGGEALPPLLQALVQHSDSTHFRTGAHHVLRYLATTHLRDQVIPVLAVLEAPELELEVPLAAHAALAALTAAREQHDEASP